MLTGTQVAYFKSRVKYWQGFFGLTDWEITILVDTKLSGDEVASVMIDTDAMQANVFLATEWHDSPVNRVEIDKAAMHEILHVLLYEIEAIGDARYVRKGELDIAVHRTINRVVKAILQ